MFVVCFKGVICVEFGEHYKNLTSIWSEDQYKDFNLRTSKILEQERFSEEDIDLVEFWFMSDESGKVNYKTCKKLADLLMFAITDKTKPFVYCSLRYQAYSKNDWEDLLTLLNGCYSHRSNLIWS